MAEYHSDPRGSITILHVDGHEFLLMFSKKGSLRGGHWHTHRQFDMILSGRIIVERRGEEPEEVLPGMVTVTEPKVPHLFRFPVDTLFLEWLDGPYDSTEDLALRKQVQDWLAQQEGR